MSKIWWAFGPIVATSFVLGSDRVAQIEPIKPVPRVRVPGGRESAFIRTLLTPAERDPFATALAATPQLVKSPSVSAMPTAPVQEAPPALNMRFDGRMISPSGTTMIFASFGDAPVILSVGQALPNGYVVKSIAEQAIEFEYPPLGTSARLELPPEPRVGIR